MADDGIEAVDSQALGRRAALLRQHERPVGPSPSYLLERAALGQRARMSIWIHGDAPRQFDLALRLIQEVMRERPHVRLVLTSVAPATVAYLRRSFPDDHAAAAPWSTGGAIGRFLGRVNPRLLVLLDGGRSLGGRTVRSVLGRDIPLVVLAVDGDAGIAAHVRDALRSAGSRGRRVVLDDRSPQAALRAVEALRDLLPDSPALPRVRQAWRIATFRDRVGQSRLWQRTTPLFSSRRIDDWGALRARLGSPRAVLVLGNGPSSEDPRLAGIAHDCLIRVNWRWRDRGLLANPKLVFVGDPETMSRIPSAVFGFWNLALERGMLLRRLTTRGPRPIEFVTMERLSPVIRDREWPARPTNGALAVLAAVALRPDRLVIAGLDLFRHPAGRYPGEVLARNDYSHVHAMETDLAIIRLALRGYSGELVVLSEILRQELAASGGDDAEVR